MSKQFDAITHRCQRGSKTCQISEDSLLCLLIALLLERASFSLYSMETQIFHNSLISDDILLQNCHGNLAAVSELDMPGMNIHIYNLSAGWILALIQFGLHIQQLPTPKRPFVSYSCEGRKQTVCI